MIKDLKKYQIKLTPFQATKNWELDNVYNEGVLLLEQTASDGSDIALALEFYDYGDGSDYPTTGSDCDMALEQQDADQLNYKEGQKIIGTFYPDRDPVNQDGTYKRSVYYQYKTAFYNDYRNPTQLWGVENIDFELAKTKRYLADAIQIFEAPTNVYGDKITPNTVRMINRTLNDDYTVTDDGYGNLIAGTNLFSRVQEVGDFGNDLVPGQDSYCSTYFNPVFIILTVSSGSAIATWEVNNTDEEYFSVQRSLNGVSFTEIATTPTGTQSYTDTTVTGSYTGATYWYRISSVNSTTTSSISNIASITFYASLPPTCHSSSFVPQYFTESLKTWLTYSLYTPTPPAPPPLAPVSLSVASGSAILTWLSSSNDHTSFAVQRSLDGVSYSDYDSVVGSPAGEIVTNGGFETGDFTGWTMVDPSNGTSVETTGWATAYIHSGSYGVAYGPYNSNTGSISQTLTTGPGNYTLTFWVNSTDIGQLFQVYWENVLVADLSSENVGYTKYTYTVSSSGATSLLEFRAQNETSYYGLDDVSVVAVGGGGTPATYTDTDVSSSIGGSTYWYQVAAVNGSGTSSFSNTASITFTQLPPIPAAPSMFTVSSGSAFLEWVDNSGGTAKYEIQKSTDNVAFTHLADVQPGTSSYRDHNVTQSISYWYKIGAYNAGGTSSFASGSIYFAIRRPDATTGSIDTVDRGYKSPWEFTPMTRRTVTLDAFGGTLTDSTSYPNYNQVVNCFQSMSIASGSRVTFDSSSVMDMSDTYALPILKIDDDGQRPCVVIWHAVHGNERDASHGLIRFLYDYLNNSGSNSNNDSIFNWFQQNYTLIVVGILNPYGWVNGTRRNVNLVDINRNCTYGWTQLSSGDSGVAPNTEENKRITDYLSGSYLPRTLIQVDSHGWGAYGQWWLGYLVSNMWYNVNVLRTQRSHYLYYNKMLYDRINENDYSDQGLTVRLSGSRGMFAVESRGALKPYINNNYIVGTHPNCFRILIEHPQTFSAGTYPTVGSIGQPRAVNTIMKYDGFYAAMAAAADAYQLVSASVDAFVDSPYMRPINSNSLFTAWNEAAGRPDWTTYSKIQLTQTQSTTDGVFTMMYYPSYSLWADSIADMGYCFYTGSAGSYMMIAGGSTSTTQSSDNASFRIENLDTGVQTQVDSNDVYGSALALCTDNSSSVWRVGGYLSSGATYDDGIYVANIYDILTGSSITWTKKATLACGGLQRHTANYFRSGSGAAYIVVAGGRTSADYTASVHAYRVDDDSYTATILDTPIGGTLAVPSARGYHCSAISGSRLFIFGGQTTSTTFIGVRKIELGYFPSSSYSAGTNMPVTASRNGLCVDPYDSDRVYIVYGASGNINNPQPTSSIYRYDMGSGAWSVVDYELGPYFESDESASIAPALWRPAVVGYGDSITIYCGGTNSSSFHNEVYELDLDTLELNNRAADTSTYGYLKLANNDATSVFLNTVPGDIFTAVATVRRGVRTPKTGSTDPLMRLVIKSGPSGTNPYRTIISQQFVPADTWTTYALPFVVTSSIETRMQAPYIRTYSKDTFIDIKAFQCFKGDIGAMHTIAGQNGSASLSCSRQFTSSLQTGTQYDRTIRFEPFFGANSSVNKNLIQFNFSASSQLQYLVLNYTSSLSASESPRTVDYATYYYPNPTGQFRLMGSGSGGTFTQSFLINSELNYNNLRYANGDYRRDNVSLKLTTHTGSTLLADMWFKGTHESASLTSQSVCITGFTTLGAGLLLYDDV